MKTLILTSAILASALVPAAASAQTVPAAVSDVAWTLALGAEWSLLPIQTPTATAGASGSSGGAR